MRLTQQVNAAIFSLFVLGVMLVACAPRPTSRQQVADRHADLAYHYAPVIYQGAATDQDYITRVDFDGDWISNNNWENQPTGDLSAYVYYSVVETETHWFLFYSLFHPRDYVASSCEEGGCHENDLESLQLAVFKDGSRYGQLQAMETLAHGDIFLYSAHDQVRGGFLKVDGEVTFEGERPVVYVETYGHGIYGRPKNLVGGLVVYRVGQKAERPASITDEVTYALLPIYEELWSRRHSVGTGQTFDRLFFYAGYRLPAAFDGDTWGADKANTPWGYDQARGFRLHRGDFFLDPAKAMSYHATFPAPFSRRYVYNPYLTDIR